MSGLVGGFSEVQQASAGTSFIDDFQSLNLRESGMHWLTAFAQEALAVDIRERMEILNKQFGDVINMSEIVIDEGNTHTYVGWDDYKISEVGKDRPLYTKEVAVCLAVLSRAFKEGSDKPSHTALNHVMMSPETFTETLTELVERVGKGTVQVFISGGEECSQGNLTTILGIIDIFNRNYPDVEFTVIENTFGICDLGKSYITDGKQRYRGDCALSYVGFDVSHRPWQIVDIKHKSESKAPPIGITWS